MTLKYRVLEMDVKGSKVITNKFDFGCCMVAQEALEVSKNKEESHSDGKFVLNFVMTILYRLLDSKVVNFSDVESMSPDTVVTLFEVFMQWFQEDLDYLSEAMSALDDGLESKRTSKQDAVHSQLGYIGYTLFKNFHVQPRDYKSWDMRDVVDILYYSGYDASLEELKNKNYL